MADPRYPRTDRTLLKNIASMAAREAVQQTFTTLGVDISTPGAVIEAQELFMSMRGLKRDWQIFRNRLLTGAAGLLLTLAVAAVMHYTRSPPPI